MCVYVGWGGRLHRASEVVPVVLTVHATRQDCAFVCMCVCVHVCVCVCVYMCVHVCVCTCILCVRVWECMGVSAGSGLIVCALQQKEPTDCRWVTGDWLHLRSYPLIACEPLLMFVRVSWCVSGLWMCASAFECTCARVCDRVPISVTIDAITWCGSRHASPIECITYSPGCKRVCARPTRTPLTPPSSNTMTEIKQNKPGNFDMLNEEFADGFALVVSQLQHLRNLAVRSWLANTVGLEYCGSRYTHLRVTYLHAISLHVRKWKCALEVPPFVVPLSILVVYTHLHTYMYINLHINIHIYVYINTYIYIYV